MKHIPILSCMLFIGLFFTGCRDRQPVKTDHDAHKINAGPGEDYCVLVNSGRQEDTMKGSPLRMSMTTIGATHIHVEYSSPGVKDRVIWGGLVPWDKVWVAGAHAATTISINKPIEINGKQVPKGTYAMFLIPGRTKWVFILNSRFDQHLTDEYDPGEDVMRVELIPEKDRLIQRLTWSVDAIDSSSGAITMQWEQIHLHLPFTII